MMQKKILLVDDESSLRRSLSLGLSQRGYETEPCENGVNALKKLELYMKNEIGLSGVVLDIRLPDIDGMEVVKEVKAKRPETEVIVITGYGNVSSAVEAMRVGVHDYLSKPFTDSVLIKTVKDALKKEKEKALDVPSVNFESEEGRLIQKREVIRVLNRTAEDDIFWNDLMEVGSEALEEYKLSTEAKAAIVSGDLKWINEHIGELTQKQLMFIYKRLEREAW